MIKPVALSRSRKAMHRCVVVEGVVTASSASTYDPVSRPAGRQEQAAPASAASAPVAAAPGDKARLIFEPGGFESCVPPRPQQAVILRADVSEGIFASGGVEGEEISGERMTPGLVIAVWDATTGAELARTLAGNLPRAP